MTGDEICFITTIVLFLEFFITLIAIEIEERKEEKKKKRIEKEKQERAKVIKVNRKQIREYQERIRYERFITNFRRSYLQILREL